MQIIWKFPKIEKEITKNGVVVEPLKPIMIFSKSVKKDIFHSLKQSVNMPIIENESCYYFYIFLLYFFCKLQVLFRNNNDYHNLAIAPHISYANQIIWFLLINSNTQYLIVIFPHYFAIFWLWIFRKINIVQSKMNGEKIIQ